MKYPSREQLKSYLAENLSLYWRNAVQAVTELPVPERHFPDHKNAPPSLLEIQLPQWASQWGINGKIPVPEWAVEETDWSKIDWFSVIFWYINSCSERNFEQTEGPIHSYSYRLKGWKNDMLWDYAWGNRIALFLRHWAARNMNKSAESLFGPLPETRFIFTHDVDAVKKTFQARCKQSVFHLFNFMRKLEPEYLFKSIGNLLLPCDYMMFDKVTDIEAEYHVKSIFFLYAASDGHWLCDPAYDIDNKKIKEKIFKLKQKGFEIGLHTGIKSWDNAQKIMEEKSRLEKGFSFDLESCRQHWLKFSFAKSWKTMDSAGISRDFTLGFNDRPGFRNSSAVEFKPWDFEAGHPLKISSVPCILMDSTLFDYMCLPDAQALETALRYLRELDFVRGTAALSWHQRTFSKDYNWGITYKHILERLKNDS